MSLGPGARVGPYEIQSAIGAGEMGVVYRAHDTRGSATSPSKFFVMIKQPDANGSAPSVVLVQNWLEELKRLVPAN